MVDWDTNIKELQTKQAAVTQKLAEVARAGDIDAIVTMSAELKTVKAAIERAQAESKKSNVSSGRERIKALLKNQDFTAEIARGMTNVLVRLNAKGDHSVEFLDKVPGIRAPRTATATGAARKARRYFAVGSLEFLTEGNIRNQFGCATIEEALTKYPKDIREHTPEEVAARKAT